MPQFSQRSKDNLATCDDRLQDLMRLAIRITDFTVLEGHRGEQRQNKLYEDGNSKLQWPESKHNKQPSRAVDIAPYPIDWQQKNRFYFLGGIIMCLSFIMSTPIRWGGDWDSDQQFSDQTFDDLVHFELAES